MTQLSLQVSQVSFSILCYLGGKIGSARMRKARPSSESRQKDISRPLALAMDLLCSTYSDSDEDGQPEPFSKRPRLANPRPAINYQRKLQPVNEMREASIPGRYVSKRERALMASLPASAPEPNVEQDIPSSTLGSLSQLDLPLNVMSLLRQKTKGHSRLVGTPEKLPISLNGHRKAVNALQWSTNHAHLLASAGMDHTVHIWNVWNKNQKIARALNFHKAAVKDVKWSKMGWLILSCGYDLTSRLIDVEKGSEVSVFVEDQVLNVVKFHPKNPNLFLSGGEKGHLRLWDIRANQVVHEYIQRLGPILDVEFSDDGREFVSSSDVSCRNVSENSIVVWDLAREVPLSNQIYGEAYTCPCIRRHPFEPCFVAQSNGNYIAIFSWSPPFRLDKFRRYEGHGVSGFPIKCSFSSDGHTLGTGSADGSIYLYNYRSTSLVKKIEAYSSACTDVAFHPTISNVVASCSWNGDVSVFE